MLEIFQEIFLEMPEIFIRKLTKICIKKIFRNFTRIKQNKLNYVEEIFGPRKEKLDNLKKKLRKI